MSLKRLHIPFLIVLILLCSCRKNEKDDVTEQTEESLYYINMFCYNMMSTYYLWNEEIADGLKSWKMGDDPIEKVKKIRYKNSDGEDIDKWSMVTDDYASLTGYVSGNTKSMGLDFELYYYDKNRTTVCAVVRYAYPGSPASEAGLKRGDVIVKLDGKTMTTKNYTEILYDTILGAGTSTLTLADGSEAVLTARDMYLDPIISNKVFEKDGKKIGYLHYTSFTLDSCQGLVDVFTKFKKEGIDELILDLRYNGGGYIVTSEVLASLLAPESVVEAENVYLTEVYNKKLTEAWGEESTSFKTEFSFKSGGKQYQVSTKGANPGIKKLYVIITGESASASECVICGLLPYMDIVLVGEQSLGKYCGGVIVDGPTWYGWVKDELEEQEYDDGVKYSDNWGIYVMDSRYADKDGKTPCMPDGFTPNYSISDDPLDSHQLGDEEETMVSFILSGMKRSARSTSSLSSKDLCFEGNLRRPSFGINLVEEGASIVDSSKR